MSGAGSPVQYPPGPTTVRQRWEELSNARINKTPYDGPSTFPGSPYQPPGGGDTIDMSWLYGHAPGESEGGGGPLDFPAWQGPYGAPLTNIQLDALGAFSKLMGVDPFAQTQDIQGAISSALMGGLYGPASNLGGGTGSIFNQFESLYPQLAAAPGFDTTEMYKTGEDVYRADLDEALARAREESSALGLAPGSGTRQENLTRTAADAAARFRLGQQEIGRQSFESAANRRLQAGELGANVGIEGGRLGVQGQDVMSRLIPTLLEAFVLPGSIASQGFQLGEAGRGAADEQIGRMMQEFARTQNAWFPQLVSLFGGVPTQQASYGPSPISQIGQLLFGGLNTAANLGWNPLGGRRGGGGELWNPYPGLVS